jgi:nitrous oxide reductase accessory protein NosL
MCVALLGIGLTGCGREPELAPPTINYGQDICDVCGMIISDERFAAAIVEINEGRLRTRLYDDIADMLVGEIAQPPTGQFGLYVHDCATHEWLDATKAFYVHSAALKTPMASGVAAAASREAAAELLNQYPGDTLDYTALLERQRQGRLFLYEMKPDTTQRLPADPP